MNGPRRTGAPRDSGARGSAARDDAPRRLLSSVHSPESSPSAPGANVHSAMRVVLHGWLACVLCFLATNAGAAENESAASLFRRGEYQKVIEQTTQAIGDSDYLETPRLLKLRAQMELGRYGDALTTLDEALLRFPFSIELRWIGRDVCHFNDQPERARKLEAEIAQLVQTAPGRFSDAGSRIVLGKFLLQQGLDPKKVLDGVYGVIRRQLPTYAPVHLATGELALEKNDFALAAKSFEQAVKLDDSDPEAHFGLVRAFAPSDAERAEAALQKTLELNPHHAGALLLAVDKFIDSERYDQAEEILQQVTNTHAHHPRAWAYRAVIAHLRNEPDRELAARDTALKHWSTNPEVDHLIGRKLSQKYRFQEGADHQQRALSFDANFLPAKIQLAQDLLRLGREEEGWGLASQVNAVDGYNVSAHNLVALQESVARFRTLESDGFLVRMDAREAEIYGQRVLDLLRRAKAVLCAKYQVELPSPIIVEIFPRQEDFAIRTFGLPGGAGFLGVCFGTVITVNGPASQASQPTCWESTLWHEFCHVVTLNKTHNRMPRWLSEGISVYEEREADAGWGQRISAHTRAMLLGDELTPIDQLSGAFLNPKSPQHLIFAYLESSLVVEYLIEKHGIETLQKILLDLGNGISINETLERHTGSLAELNAGFVEYAHRQAHAVAPDADWTDPDLPLRADTESIRQWLEQHPHNLKALGRLADLQVAAGQWEAAKGPLENSIRLFPRNLAADGPYPALLRVYRELGDQDAEFQLLQTYVGMSDAAVDAYARLCELSQQREDWTTLDETADRWLAVAPVNPVPHRFRLLAAEQQNQVAAVVECCQALLQLTPIDVAELELKLSTALMELRNPEAAYEHALLAAEEAPRYRAALRHLLAVRRQRAVEAETAADARNITPPPPPLPVTEAGP